MNRSLCHQSFMSRLARSVIGPVLGLTVWGAIGWYLYTRLPQWCEAYWQLPEARHLDRLWSDRVQALSHPVLWNPGTAFSYVQAVLAQTTVSSKLALLVTVSRTACILGRVFLVYVGFRLIRHTFIRIRDNYRRKASEDALQRMLNHQILPRLDRIEQELLALRQGQADDTVLGP